MTVTERDEDENPRRESVWSVSAGWLTAYFVLFTLQFIAGLALVIFYETVVVTDDSFIETLMNILGRAATIPILSASTSYIFAEGGRLTVVISNWVERKLEERRVKREQALVEIGRQKGIEEGIELGRAYERKRMADEANGVDSSESRREDDGNCQ